MLQLEVFGDLRRKTKDWCKMQLLYFDFMDMFLQYDSDKNLHDIFTYFI